MQPCKITLVLARMANLHVHHLLSGRQKQLMHILMKVVPVVLIKKYRDLLLRPYRVSYRYTSFADPEHFLFVLLIWNYMIQADFSSIIVLLYWYVLSLLFSP